MPAPRTVTRTIRRTTPRLALPLVLAGLGIAFIAQAQSKAGPTAQAQQQPTCDCQGKTTCLSYTDVLKKPVLLTGTLVTLNAGAPDGRPYHPYALKLAAPLCVQGDAALGPDLPESRSSGPLDTLQLAGTFNQQQARGHIGQPQVVRGTLFAPTTAWHLTPALVDVQSLTNPPRPAPR